METPHKKYFLPHKNHVVVEDVKKIAEDLEKIDTDISNIETNVTSLNQKADEIIPFLANVDNKTIQNIKPGYYLKTSQNEIVCEEGGEDKGGKRFEILQKQSTDDFDTSWSRLSSINKENLFNFQTVSSVESQENEAYIFKDEIENQKQEEDKATRKNYGVIKIGPGLDVENGVISVSRDKKATKNDYGVVKIGDGIAIENGALKVQKRPNATHKTFGMVKLNHEFGLKDETLHVIKSGEKILYQMGEIRPIQNGIIDLNPECAHYRAFVNEDLIFSLESNFTQTKDIAFVLEIISDGVHVVSFEFSTNLENPQIAVNRGKTVIKFSRVFGSQKWEAEISRLDAPNPVLLTTERRDSVKSDLIMSSNGSSWDTYSMLGNNSGREITFSNNPRELCFHFSKSVVVEYVYFYDLNETTLSLFELLASYDNMNWTRIIYKTNEKIEKETYTDKKGAYRHFKLRFSSECHLRGVKLFGFEVKDNDSELLLLTPKMSIENMAGIKLSCSQRNDGDLINATNPSINNYIQVAKGDSDYPFIEYEFEEPKIANFIDLASYTDTLDTTPRWFNILASNDGNTWDLLLAREYQENWFPGETRYFELDNEKAYKKYRFVCKYVESSSRLFRLARFRLFRKEHGISYFETCTPELLIENQDGYEVSSSSNASEDRKALFAFDSDNDSYWQANETNSWLQLKLNEKAAFTAVHIKANEDNKAPKTFKIEGSNDNENWACLGYEIAEWTSKESKYFYFQNETAFLYYRLLVESIQNSDQVQVAKFELGMHAKSYKVDLNHYEYLVPILTSNSDRGYEVTCSSQYNDSSEAAFRLFDGSDSQWTTRPGDVVNQWVAVKLPVPTKCSIFSLQSSDASSRVPKSFAIEASSDGTSWTTLVKEENFAWNTYTTIAWDNPNADTAYSYYRFYIYKNSGDGNFVSLRRFDLVKQEIIREY